MTTRFILILTIVALVLGGVAAAFVQAGSGDDSGSPLAPVSTSPDPAQEPDPVKTSVNSDARHDDVESEMEAFEADWDDDDQGDDDNTLASTPSVPSARSTPSVRSKPSAPSKPSVRSTPSAPSAPSAATN